MKTIQKFTLDLSKDLQALTLREGYRIVKGEYMITEKSICLWVEIPLRADIPKQQRMFAVRETNQPVPLNYLHVHTAVDTLAPQAFHIFEVPLMEHQPQTKDALSYINGSVSGYAA